MQSKIPDEVIQFLEKHIRSVDELEALLLISGSPETEWSVCDVDAVIRSTPENVSRWLESFAQAGIVSRSGVSGAYQYRPSTAELRRIVTLLSETYQTSRHRIIELIYTKPPAGPNTSRLSKPK